MSYFKRFLLLGGIGMLVLTGLMLTSYAKVSTVHASGCNTVAEGRGGAPNYTPSWSNNCTVSDGNISNMVYAIQTVMDQANSGAYNQCGHIATDGDFGPNTLAAVKCFQSYHSLSADGIVGPLTWGKLASTLTFNAPASGNGWEYYHGQNASIDSFRMWNSSPYKWYVLEYNPNTQTSKWCQMDLSSPCN